jgi:hypothetical protein
MWRDHTIEQVEDHGVGEPQIVYFAIGVTPLLGEKGTQCHVHPAALYFVGQPATLVIVEQDAFRTEFFDIYHAWNSLAAAVICKRILTE